MPIGRFAEDRRAHERAPVRRRFSSSYRTNGSLFVISHCAIIWLERFILSIFFMPIIHTSSVVIVGGEYAAHMFDERNLEEAFGDMDGKDTVRMGPVGRYSYARGTSLFAVTPERIDLRHNGDQILPEQLVQAAIAVAGVLESVSPVVRVTGLGLNCDSIFDEQEIGRTGIEFCEGRLIQDSTKSLIGVDELSASSARFYFSQSGVSYDVRIEPHFSSDGKNLFTAINGHQDVQENHEIPELLTHVDSMKQYVNHLHERLVAGS